MKAKVHRKAEDGWKLKSVTISRESTGRYYAAVLYQCEYMEKSVQKDVAKKMLGIDFAMHGLAVFSDGTKADYPMYYRKAELKLAREQRKLSHTLAEQYDAIAVEDLNMKGMSRALHLGKSTMDNGYGEFLGMLGYKLEERGHLEAV